MRRAILPFMLVAAFGCEAQRAFPVPPAGSYSTTAAQVKIRETVVTANVAKIAPEFFRAAKVQPLLGRLFLDDEYPRADGATPRLTQAVTLLSHAFWTDTFAASPSVIGTRIDIDGHPTVIVGVLPRTFTAPGDTQLWIPKW